MPPFFGFPSRSRTVINNNVILGGGYRTPVRHCCSGFMSGGCGMPSWMKWTMGFQMANSLISNMFAMPQSNYGMYPYLNLSNTQSVSPEGAGGSSVNVEDENLKNMEKLYSNCTFSKITENGVTKYYCAAPDGKVYSAESLSELQGQLADAGVTASSKRTTSGTEQAEFTLVNQSEEAGGPEEVSGAAEAAEANPVGGNTGSGKIYKKADLSKYKNFVWIKYSDLSESQKAMIKDCKTISEVMEKLGNGSFGPQRLQRSKETYQFYRDANPNAIDGDKIVDITKLDLIVHKDYKKLPEPPISVKSANGQYAYYVDNKGKVTCYKKDRDGNWQKCDPNELKQECPGMYDNAQKESNKRKTSGGGAKSSTYQKTMENAAIYFHMAGH